MSGMRTLTRACSRTARCTSLVAGLAALALAGPGCGPPDEPEVFTAEFQSGIEAGVMLSAWSNGDELIFAGGALSASPGVELGASGNVLRYQNGALCRELVADRTIWWIDGRASGEYWVVGEGGLIMHNDGGVWTDESVTTDAILYGIWADAEQPIAVGGDPFVSRTGEVWRRENGTWVQLASDLPGVAFKVWEDWIVGDGVAWQIDGDQLIERFPPNGEKLLTVRGRGDGEVFAVGGFPIPQMLHWTGDAWQEIDVPPTCASSGLNGVWTAPGEDVWIGGFFGGVGRYDGETWDCPETVLTQEHFHAVWQHQGEMWWAGGNLLEPGGELATIGRHGEESIALAVTDCQ